MGEGIWGVNSSFFLGHERLKCLLDIHVEMQWRELNIYPSLEFRGGVQAGNKTLRVTR